MRVPYSSHEHKIFRKQLEQRDAWSKNGPAFYAWQDQTVEAPLEPELEIVDGRTRRMTYRARSPVFRYGCTRVRLARPARDH